MALRGWTTLGTVAWFALGLSACSGSDVNGPGAGGTTAAGGSSAGGTAAGGAAAGGTATGGTATGGTATCTSLAPTGTARKLIISQIVPGTGIEVFNPGTTAVNVSAIWFCSQFDYQQVTAPSGKTAVAPGAFVVLAWPATYTLATATGGELLLNLDAFGPTPENVLNYVCWGDHQGGRAPGTPDGANIGIDQLYTGACAPAMTAGALSRKPATNGMDAASYDTTSASSLADCQP